ncbi:hypothetical protein V6Z11_A05G010000 [Gossypium hirsutum]
MGRGWRKDEQRWSGLRARRGRCARGTWVSGRWRLLVKGKD